MKKVLTFLFVFLASSGFAQQNDSLKHVELESVTVSATRVGNNAPVAYSNMDQAQIKRNNAASNIPFVLQTLPSVVSYSEGGTPIGNTSFRVRGTDANRINVTLNGMPLNNPESQDVYWVNLPDLSNSLQSLQVQRGVGTSTNGTASFGASISLKTTGLNQDAYGEASTSIGSYNAFASTIAAGTGILKNDLLIDGRYSRTTGDGYIRNGKVDHKSVYASLSHYTDRQLIRFIYINGIQHTGITWNGISTEDLKTKGRRYNSAGEYKDDAGNVMYYDNETDNYYSNIAQAIYTRQLSNIWALNANFSYNNGYGYYENYKVDQKLKSKFGLPPQTLNNGMTYERSDVVRRKFLSNNFYMGSVNVSYKADKLNVTGGGMYSYFDGSHYGKLPWVKYNENISPDYKWYTEQATKRDLNVFLKAEYRPIDALTVFGELQERYVDYRMKGIDDEMMDITQNKYYNFFNPKVGASFRFLDRNEVYASFGIANREPLRADLKVLKRKMKPERLYDLELGYRFGSKCFSFDANFYYMNYKDQMVQTGKLSDVGYKLQENVPDSYRTGIEVALAYTPMRCFRFDGNMTLSRNKIKNYTAYYDVYAKNAKGEYKFDHQEETFLKSTDISYSPDVVGSVVASFTPMEDLSFSIVGKYVGKMYFDNTSDRNKQMDDYFIANFVAGYSFSAGKIGKIDLQFFVNNIFNKKYIANAVSYGTYKYMDGSPDYHDNMFFPQAPCNIMGRVGIRF